MERASLRNAVSSHRVSLQLASEKAPKRLTLTYRILENLEGKSAKNNNNNDFLEEDKVKDDKNREQ